MASQTEAQAYGGTSGSQSHVSFSKVFSWNQHGSVRLLAGGAQGHSSGTLRNTLTQISNASAFTSAPPAEAPEFMQIKIYVKGLPLGRSKALRPQPCPPMRGVPGGCLLVPVSAPVAHLDPFTIEVGRFYLSADWHLTPTCARPGVLERGLALNKV